MGFKPEIAFDGIKNLRRRQERTALLKSGENIVENRWRPPQAAARDYTHGG
jgi:hypothetical protein